MDDLRLRKPLNGLERRLVHHITGAPRALDGRHASIVRYALNLARIRLLRTPGGYDVDLSGPLADFRGWLSDALTPVVAGRGGVDWGRLTSVVPDVYERLAKARTRVFGHFAGQLDPELLDREVCHKALVLVLGGGGGSGFAHLGAFSLLKDLAWVPDLIVGASMGSLMGLFRSLRREWDPVGTLLSLPRRFDRGSLFRPFGGQTRYGFPGAFFLRLNEIAHLTLELLVGRPHLTFRDLEIPLEIVVSGIRLGMKSAFDEAGRFTTVTGLSVRRRVTGFLKILGTLVANPRFLEEIVFGRDERTRDGGVVEAVGFSCAVPGLFCYDLLEGTDPVTLNVIDGLVRERELWGLADGGVVNNVPSRVAWESVEQGNIGTRNAFIYALDPFAPQVNNNVMFMPVQQIAHISVASNQAYADLHRSYISPPSPLELVLGWRRARTVISRARTELEADRAFLKTMKQPLPPFEALSAA